MHCGGSCGRIMSCRGPTSLTLERSTPALALTLTLSQLKNPLWSTRRRPAPPRCPFIVNNPALLPYSACLPTSPCHFTVPVRRERPRPTLLRCLLGVNNLALPLYSARLSLKPIPV
jgi:hypothetical protein